MRFVPFARERLGFGNLWEHYLLHQWTHYAIRPDGRWATPGRRAI